MGDTRWATANVPTMWVSAQAADTQMAWDQVGAWARTHDLLMHHELRLRALQGQLSSAWPPERSPAAGAFVDHMDGLLIRISQAREDAAKNRDALKLLLESLASAKKDMAVLKKTWDEFEARQSTSPIPFRGPSWQETLNTKAKARMDRNDREVFEATRLMAVPEVETEPRAERERIQDPTSTGPIDTDGQYFEGQSHLPNSLSPEALAGPAGSDLQLAGAPALDLSSPNLVSPAVTPSPTITPSTPERQSLGPATVPVVQSPLGATKHPTGTSVSRNPSIGVGARSLTGQVPHAVPAPLGIGGQRSGARVSPVGGVISPTSTGMAGIPPMRAGGSVAAESNSGQSVATWQWEVAQGVAPVIEPSPELPFELGPGVIGIDR